MREIKFAWVCRNIKFNEICREELTDEMLLNGSYPSYITSDNCEIIAKILPVGLKDKNGKEIWEGDILGRAHKGYDYKHVVKWSKDSAGFHMAWVIDSLNAGYDIRVIGNIYENPELLK